MKNRRFQTLSQARWTQSPLTTLTSILRLLSRQGLAVVTLLALLVSCSPKLQPSTTTQVTTIVRDSIVVHRDTIVFQVPVETSSAFNVQSSHLETTVAWSDAVVDSTGVLSHTLSNKPVKVEKEFVYVDRVVTEYKDSLVVKEVPVEVEVPVRYVPKFYKGCLVWSVLSVLLLGLWLYLKFRQ